MKTEAQLKADLAIKTGQFIPHDPYPTVRKFHIPIYTPDGGCIMCSSIEDAQRVAGMLNNQQTTAATEDDANGIATD